MWLGGVIAHLKPCSPISNLALLRSADYEHRLCSGTWESISSTFLCSSALIAYFWGDCKWTRWTSTWVRSLLLRSSLILHYVKVHVTWTCWTVMESMLVLFMAALRSSCGHYIFILCFLLLSSFFLASSRWTAEDTTTKDAACHDYVNNQND